jgi:hypothetical protein
MRYGRDHQFFNLMTSLEVNTMNDNSNISNPTNGKIVLTVLQPGILSLIKAATKWAYQLSHKYPQGIQETMVVLLDNHRYKFKDGMWYLVGDHCTGSIAETLIIPLAAQMVEIIRKEVSENLPALMEQPLALSNIAFARYIARKVLPKAILDELETLLSGGMHYCAIIFDGLLRNWIGFDIDNPKNEQIALERHMVRK